MSQHNMPYSVNLAGPGLDQPYLSKFMDGWNITVGIKPTYQFKERAGMATSTRNTAIRIWGNLPDTLHTRLKPNGDENLARILFKEDNRGKSTDGNYISGFQDSIGICGRGIKACYYDGEFLPKIIRNIGDDNTINWLEENIRLFELETRPNSFNLFKNENRNLANAEKLAVSSLAMMNAIRDKDLILLEASMSMCRVAYTAIFPSSITKKAADFALKNDFYGWKMNGAGAGYMIAVSQKGGIPIKIRR